MLGNDFTAINMGQVTRFISSISLDQIPDEHPVARFTPYWYSSLNSKGLFPRRIFNPGAAVDIIPWMLIIDPCPDIGPEVFRYRLCGTGIIQLVGVELTGSYVGDNMHQNASRQIRRELLTAIEHNRPQYSSTELPISGREYVSVMRGVFPVSTDGESVDQAFVIVAETGCRVRPIRKSWPGS